VKLSTGTSASPRAVGEPRWRTGDARAGWLRIDKRVARSHVQTKNTDKNSPCLTARKAEPGRRVLERSRRPFCAKKGFTSLRSAARDIPPYIPGVPVPTAELVAAARPENAVLASRLPPIPSWRLPASSAVSGASTSESPVRDASRSILPPGLFAIVHTDGACVQMNPPRCSRCSLPRCSRYVNPLFLVSEMHAVRSFPSICDARIDIIIPNRNPVAYFIPVLSLAVSFAMCRS